MAPKRKEYTITDLYGKSIMEFPRKVIGPMENDIERSMGWVPYKKDLNQYYGFADGYDSVAKEQFEDVMKNYFHLEIEADPADTMKRVVLANGARTNWNDNYREDLKAINAMPECKEKYERREKAAVEYMKGLFYEFAKGGVAVIPYGETEPRQVRYDPYKGHVIISEPFSKCEKTMEELEEAYDNVEKREVIYNLPYVRSKPSIDVKKPDPVKDPGEFTMERPVEPTLEVYEPEPLPRMYEDMLEGTTKEELWRKRQEEEMKKRGVTVPVKPDPPKHLDVLMPDKQGVDRWLRSENYPKILPEPGKFTEEPPVKRTVRDEPQKPKRYLLKRMFGWLVKSAGEEVRAYQEDHRNWEQEVQQAHDDYNVATHDYDAKKAEYENSVEEYENNRKELFDYLDRNYARVHGNEPDYQEKKLQVMQEAMQELIDMERKAREYDLAKRQFDKDMDDIYNDIHYKFENELEENQKGVHHFDQVLEEYDARQPQREAAEREVNQRNANLTRDFILRKEAYEKARQEYSEKKLKYEEYLRKDAKYNKAVKDYEANIVKYEQEKAIYDKEKSKKATLEYEAEQEYDDKIDAINNSPEKKEFYENRFLYRYKFGPNNWKDSVRQLDPSTLEQEIGEHKKRCQNYQRRKKEAPREAGKLYTDDVILDSVYGNQPKPVQEILAKIDREEAEEVGKVINAKSISVDEYVGFSIMQEFYKEARAKVLDEAKQKPKDAHFDFSSIFSKGSKEQFSKTKLADKTYRKKLESEAKIKGDKETQTEERRWKLLGKSDNTLAKEYANFKGKTSKTMQTAMKC